MEKKKKLLVIALSALAAIVIIAAVVIALSLNFGHDYMSYIKKGDRFFAAGEYSRAVAAFQEAIELDSAEPEGYDKLAQVYETQGYTALAADTLEKGANATGSSLLRERLAAVRGISGAVDPAGESGKDEGTNGQIAASEPGLNTAALKFIAEATFGDYEKVLGAVKQENITTDGDTYYFGIPDMHIQLIYWNSSSSKNIDASTGRPFSNLRPMRVKYTDLSYLFLYEGTISYDELKGIGGIERVNKTPGSVEFDACGCHIQIETDSSASIMADSDNTISFTVNGLVVEENTAADDGVSELKGKVINAATGQGIPDATVKAYKGTSAVGTPVETKTDSAGNYSLVAESGEHYYITAEKDGFIKGEFDAYLMSNVASTTADLAITEKLADNVIRIVLTWGSTPRDLDSYLATADGRIMTKFTNKTAYGSNGEKIAELDLDDMDGNGPETTTLYDMEGSYEFYVVDFNVTKTMANSGAQVKVYKGDSLVETIDISKSVVNVWSVIKINHGEIEVINAPKSVTLTPGIK